MKMHAVQTETILSRIAANGDLARVAAAHHEWFDGTSYPRGLAGRRHCPRNSNNHYSGHI
jgi:HD-GYP domain-containing protein (c-di-GMP phosphodiesterase class II)